MIAGNILSKPASGGLSCVYLLHLRSPSPCRQDDPTYSIPFICLLAGRPRLQPISERGRRYFFCGVCCRAGLPSCGKNSPAVSRRGALCLLSCGRKAGRRLRIPASDREQAERADFHCDSDTVERALVCAERRPVALARFERVRRKPHERLAGKWAAFC